VRCAAQSRRKWDFHLNGTGKGYRIPALIKQFDVVEYRSADDVKAHVRNCKVVNHRPCGSDIPPAAPDVIGTPFGPICVADSVIPVTSVGNAALEMLASVRVGASVTEDGR